VIGRREVLLAFAASVAVAVAMHAPLVAHLGHDVPRDLGDPLAQAWQVAWGGHALLHQPLDFFQSNQFWPYPDTLAFSDSLAGYAPVGAIGEGPEAAMLRYGLLYLLAYALAGFGAYLLARELGAGPGAAAVAGAAFAFAPWRIEQSGHLHVLSSGGIPLTVFLLLRGWRTRSPGLLLGGWLVAAWQLSLGWTLGLQLAYLLAVMVAVAAVRWWRADPRPAVGRPALAALAAGILIFAATGTLIARPYLRVADDHPEARRGPGTVVHYSGGPRLLITASADSVAWGGLTGPAREGISALPEKTLFPGLAILALAILGALKGPLPRRLLAGATLGTAILAMGFTSADHRWLFPYGWLYEIGPGWDAVRVPTRLWTLTSLGLALLAAGGAAWLLARAPRAGLVAVALVAAVLLDGSAVVRHPAAPREPAGLRGIPAPLLELPLRAEDNRRYLLWSTAGFPALVNGRSSTNPRSFLELEERIAGFPDAQSARLLREMGVRSVVLHRARVPGTPWAGWAARGAPGLGRRLGRELVVYALAHG
jgi:hypothetical protein